MKVFQFWIFLFGCTMLLTDVHGQTPATDVEEKLGNLLIENFDNKFLNRPQSVWSVIRSKKSKKIYFGTFEGILEYDGNSVQDIPIIGEIEDQINPSYTRTLLEDEDNTLYAAGNGFFGTIRTNSFGKTEYRSLLEKIPDSINPYELIFWGGVQKGKNIFLYTRDLIFSWDGNSFDNVWSLADSNQGSNSYGQIQTLIKVENRIFARVWGLGLFELINETFEFVENSDLYADNRVESIVRLASNELAIFSSTTDVHLLTSSGNLKRLKNTALNKWLRENKIYNASELDKLSDGKTPLISFEGGLILLDDTLKIVDQIDLSDGLLSNTITSIHRDSNDDLYLTSLLSASRIKMSNAITTYDQSYGIKGLVQKIKNFSDGLYFSTTEDIFKVKVNKNPAKNNEIEDLKVNDIPKDFIEFNTSIISANNLNFSEIQNNQKRIISDDRLIESPIQSLLDPSLIITTHPIEGVLFFRRFSNGQIRKVSSAKINKTRGVLGIREISKGKLFVEAINDEGSFLAHYDKQGRISFERLLTPSNDEIFNSDDFPKNSLFNSEIDEAFFIPAELNIFNTGIGFLIFDQDLDVYQFSADFKLESLGQNLLPIFEKNLVDFDRFAIITGRKQFTSLNKKTKNNWFLTESGLLEVQFSKDASFEILNQYPYGSIDINELSGAFLAANSNNQDLIYLGSKDSKVISFIPEKYVNQEKIEVDPIINSFTLNDEIQNLSQEYFSYSRSRNVKIAFSFPSFDKVTNNQFRFRLVGLNQEWSEWSNNTESVYTNLYEGDYVFELQALDTDGQMSRVIPLPFSINPPWYRTYFAYFFYLVLGVLTVFLFGKFQAKRSLDKAENERKEKDLEEARLIQQNMLPKEFPKSPQLDIDAGLITSTEVGGDYYDFFEEEDKSIYAICGDATGHGTASGMMVSITKSALSGLPIMSVEKLLARLNNIVKKINLGRLRMSLTIVKITSNEIELSGAAMPPAFFYDQKEKQCKEIMLEGLPLGGLKNETFTKVTNKFEKGDVLILLSDGLPEAMNENGELFDYARIENLINASSDQSSEEIKNKLFEELNTWLNGGIPEDDVTLVVVKKTA